jgi:CRP/FNR family cyclic AMP-dependent transcriptional regulator
VPTAWPLDELTDADQAMLAGVAETVEVPAGAAIVTVGERPGALFLVEAGDTRVEVRGREIARLGPGSLVGEMSFAGGDAASATVSAIGAVRMARVSSAHVAGCAARDPGFPARLYRGIARVIGERLRRHNEAWFEADAAFGELPVFVDGFEAMRAATLPPVVVDAIERYQRVGDPNRGFIYRWAWHGLGETHLSVVPERWREHVQTTKLLMVIVNVLFDDLADVPGNELEFQASIDRLMDVEAPSRGADIDGPYFELLFALWREIEERARELPGWERHRLLWRFDYEQVFAAMRYVVLTRTYPGLDNLTEHRAYMPHSKNIMVFATLDLMTEPGAAARNAREIGLVREAAWHAQALTQIANMVVTWRREVPARDFSSRIFPLAVDHGALTRAELGALAPEEIVARIEASGVEERLLEELRAHRARVAEVAGRAVDVDLLHYERAMEHVLAMELAARGLL